MVQNSKYNHIDGIRRPTHRSCRRFTVVKFGSILRDQDGDNKGPYVGDQHTGRSMETGRLLEIVQEQTCNKTD